MFRFLGIIIDDLATNFVENSYDLSNFTKILLALARYGDLLKALLNEGLGPLEY